MPRVPGRRAEVHPTTRLVDLLIPFVSILHALGRDLEESVEERLLVLLDQMDFLNHLLMRSKGLQVVRDVRELLRVDDRLISLHRRVLSLDVLFLPSPHCDQSILESLEVLHVVENRLLSN